MQQNTPTYGAQRVAAALASAHPKNGGVLSGEAREGSLAEMAQRDLDAALQLLADRAQYITGASGAAIALCRTGKKDMLCRASSGSNAPELGALLSTEFGLSGESVRTRQLLRCDDVERDTRLNREVCRQLGIASVVVMPVVNDDEVLGVFELISGKANAFGERDFSAVQRLSQMVETAIRLAHATETLPERLKRPESTDCEVEGQFLSDVVVEAPGIRDKGDEAETSQTKPEIAVVAMAGQAAAAMTVSEVASVPLRPVEAAPAKKPLFWSASVSPAADTEKPTETDQSHVPPVLRGLSKCVACGFPISAGRVLCVECEEKKWRGQLRASRAAASKANLGKP